MWQNYSPISATCTFKWMLNACLKDDICKIIFSQEQTALLRSKAAQCFLFRSWNRGEFSGIYRKKQAQRTQESNHICTCLCSHSGAVGDCGVRRPDIDLGRTDFSGQAARIHKKKHHSPWGSLGFPLLLSSPTSASENKVQSLHLLVCTFSMWN